MAVDEIREWSGRIVGYIETKPNGDKTGKDFYGRIVGYYDKSSNTTKNFYGTIIAKGDILSALVWNCR